MPQHIAVVAINDHVAEATAILEVEHIVNSSDVHYDGLSTEDFVLSLYDNNVAGTMVEPSEIQVQEGGPQVEACVRLSSEPTAEVQVSITAIEWYSESSTSANFFNWSSGAVLKVNNMGIPEPVSKKIVYPDLILVPLVGFDKNKCRLGYGGGYYDRYIEKVGKLKKFKTVGLSFSFQEIEKLPVNKFDKKLDFIITENKIYS